MEALERHKKENADEAARQWKLTMAETRVKAAQQQAANLKVQLAECRKRELAEKMKRHMSFKHEETYHEEHEKLEEEMRQQLAQLQKMFDDEHKALEAAKAEAEKKRSDASEAAETEACANKQLQWALLPCRWPSPYFRGRSRSPAARTATPSRRASPLWATTP